MFCENKAFKVWDKTQSLFFNAGKITQKPVESVDGLTHTYTMIFNNETSSDEFRAESVANDNFTVRANHCNSNSISYSIERGV